MNVIQIFEETLKNDVQELIEKIIAENEIVDINSNGGRVGDQISKFLEEKFEKFKKQKPKYEKIK